MARIYVVIAPDPLVLGAYTLEDSGHLHARCVTGAVSVPCELLDSVPATVREDMASDDWDEGEDTPVVSVEDFDDPKSED